MARFDLITDTKIALAQGGTDTKVVDTDAMDNNQVWVNGSPAHDFVEPFNWKE